MDFESILEEILLGIVSRAHSQCDKLVADKLYMIQRSFLSKLL